jgi:hypothetical protein
MCLVEVLCFGARAKECMGSGRLCMSQVLLGSNMSVVSVSGAAFSDGCRRRDVGAAAPCALHTPTHTNVNTHASMRVCV